MNGCVNRHRMQSPAARGSDRRRWWWTWSARAALLLAAAMIVGSCTNAGGTEAPRADEDDHAAVPTNRINIPASVRRNLGIQFATVERRAVAQTLRLPGRFEWVPTAERAYRTPLEGRVELAVEQYEPVEAGTLLYRIDSPQWRDMQREIEEATAVLDLTDARLSSLALTMEAHEIHEQGLRDAVDLWTERITQIEELNAAGAGRVAQLAEARIALNEAMSAFGEVMEKHAELNLRQRELESEQRATASRLDLLLRSAATILRVDVEFVNQPVAGASDEAPRWKATDLIEVRATSAGVVDDLAVTDGAWVERGSLVATTVDPAAIRFRATGLQSDLTRLRAGLPARIVPYRGDGVDPALSVSGSLEIGLHADPQQRTIELIVRPESHAEWTRAGVSAFVEITLDESAGKELAIPLSCVVRDGLTPVIFRRDPNDPNVAIKINADLGIDDGRWVVVESGLGDGDEVVLDGAYQLMLASSSSAGDTMRGGHFHADGTFHAEDE